MKPTQAQIEAATQAIMKELDSRGDTQTSDNAYREIALAALTAAAEAGPPVNVYNSVYQEAIERCAQVAEHCAKDASATSFYMETATEIAAAIRALKEEIR